MRVLITGHLGYIGVEMTSYLADVGHDIVGLDTDLYAECDFLAPPDPVPTLDIDLRDVTVADLLGFDAVIHLAALSNDPLADLNPLLTYSINRDASIRLAEAAKAAGVRAFYSHRHAACTGVVVTKNSTRARRLTRLRPMANQRSTSNARSQRWPTTPFRRCTCATPRRMEFHAGCERTSW